MLRIGDIVDDRFEVEAMLGEGGLACVYRVRHRALGSVHALKLLSWRKKSLAERLILEGRIQAQLQHPNIVAVTDLVKHDGQLGLLMEYVDSRSLEEYLISHGALGIEGGLGLFAQVLSAVGAAHSLGVTHRDLKPANILLARTNRGYTPKVTDFGIAKVVADIAGASTAAGSTMGTPGYLAPEQVTDSSMIDHRADIFALGAIVWELITGRLAFAGEDGELSVVSTTANVAPPIATFVPEIAPHEDAAIARAMCKRPEDRFESCLAFAEALFSERPELLAQFRDATSTTMVLSLAGLDGTIDSPVRATPAPAPALAPRSSETLVAAATIPPRQEGLSTSWKLALGAVGVVVLGLSLLVGAMLAAKQEMDKDDGVAVVVPVAAPEATNAPTPVEPVAVDPALVDVPAVDPALVDPTVVEPVDPAPIEPAPTAVPVPVVPVPSPEATVPADPVPVAPVPVVPPDPVPVEPVPTAPTPRPEPQLPVPEVAPSEPVGPVLPIKGITGRWQGNGAGRPIAIDLTSSPSGQLSGVVTLGVHGERRETLTGTLSSDGRVQFTAADLQFTGTLSGTKLSGTYTNGSRPLKWSTTKR